MNHSSLFADRATAAICLVAMFLAAVLAFVATSQGVGLAGDSMAYLPAAREIAGGGSVLHMPMTHWPPAFPAGLGLVGRWLGMDPLVVARPIVVLLFSVTAFLVALLVARVAGSGRVGAVCGLAYATTPGALMLSVTFMTEHIYLPLSLGCLLMVMRYWGSPKLATLWLISLLISLAMLLKYVGASLLAPAALAVLAAASGRIPGKIARLGLLALAVVPLAGWLLRNSLLFESATNRTLSLMLPDWQYQGRWFFAAIARWASPPMLNLQGRAIFTLAVGLLIVVVACIWYLKSRAAPVGTNGDGGRQRSRGILLAYAAAYVGIYAISNLLLDPIITFGDRDQLPLLPIFFAMAGVGWVALSRRESAPGWPRAVILATLAGLFLLNASASVGVARDGAREGIGFNSRFWTEGPVSVALDGVPDGLVVYSNVASMLRVHQSRNVRDLPETRKRSADPEPPGYRATVEALRRQVHRSEAVVLFYVEKGFGPEYGDVASWTDQLGIEPTYPQPQVALFAARGSGNDDGG